MRLDFNGRKVILNSLLTKPGEPYEVPRTWKERLFTRPWQPLKKTRTVTPVVPSNDVYGFNDPATGEPCIAMHPDLWEKLDAELTRRNMYCMDTIVYPSRGSMFDTNVT